MDIKEIKRLIGLVEDASISHLSIEEDGKKIEIKKELVAAPVAAQSVVLPQAAPAPVADVAASEAAAPVDDGLVDVKAQMVGTFYAAPDPDSPAFVKVGDSLSVGQKICIIEAMKLFNEIESEVTGTIEQVCVSNGDAVEFGQVLFRVRP